MMRMACIHSWLPSGLAVGQGKARQAKILALTRKDLERKQRNSPIKIQQVSARRQAAGGHQ
jgi:hypothetical protein